MIFPESRYPIFSKMTEANDYILKSTKGQKPHTVLIAFDVDMTLTITPEKAVQMPNIKKYKQAFKKITGALSEEQIDILLNLSNKTAAPQLIEEVTPSIIKELQDSCFKTIALTGSLTGKLGQTSCIEVWRYEALQKLSLDFSKSFPDKTIELTDVPAYLGRHAVFYKGILSANGGYHKRTKGTALISLLKTLNYKPTLVVLVDDTEAELTDLEAALKAYDDKIQFVGVVYQGGRNLSCGDISEQDFCDFWHKLAQQVQAVIS